MNTSDRTRRLVYLYALQKRTNDEIIQLEQQAEDEANAIRRARQAAHASRAKLTRKAALCGTDSGYYRHRRKFNEEACQACKLAHRIAERVRTQNKAEQVPA